MPDRTLLRRGVDEVSPDTWRSRAADLELPDERPDRRTWDDRTDVVVKSTWLETPLPGGWMSAARLLVQGGQVVVGELRIFPTERVGAARRRAGQWSAEFLGDAASAPAGGLSVKVVRRVRLGDYRRFTTQILAHLRNTYRSAEAREALKIALGPVETSQLRARHRRERAGGRPDAFYAALAGEYQREIQRGNRHPVATLATRQGVKPPQMRDMVREARERGMLSRFAHGRAGGEQTSLAKEVLKRQRRATAPQRRKRRQ